MRIWRRRTRRAGTPCRHCTTEPGQPRRSRPKPAWVRQEIIRLKAWSPDMGCRQIALTFNRQFERRGETVGKTFVAGVLRASAYEIADLRRRIKHRIPKPLPRNRTWALDLTGNTDSSSRQRMILGVLDHGTRACLALTALTDKRSLRLLHILIGCFRKYGLPRTIRVDNEACFNSRLMRGALTLLDVRLQATQPHCPWQNGRIERFFGTFKAKMNQIMVADAMELRLRLGEFRTWYNHIRPHQHLGGRTPAEAWNGICRSMAEPKFYSTWDGLLTGWYFPS
jgi:putative transposase